MSPVNELRQCISLLNMFEREGRHKDIYGMESQRGSQYSNKTFRMPWSGHRITYSSSSTCCGLGILYPSWSKLTIFLPSIRGYGEPPKKEKVTSCYNTLLQGMSSPKICCCLCCCFYSKWKELTVAVRTIYLQTRLFIYLILAPEKLQKAVNSSHGVSSCCNKVSIKLSANFRTVARDS